MKIRQFKLFSFSFVAFLHIRMDLAALLIWLASDLFSGYNFSFYSVQIAGDHSFKIEREH